MPRRLESLEELDPSHDVILCDVWGVVHNGVAPFPLAVDALRRARSRGKTVVLVTNSPRPADGVIRQFATIGVARDCWDDIVTSGDVTRSLVAEGPRNLFFLGPERDRSLVKGLDVALVDIPEAEGVLCTGLFDDETETPDDYADMLARFHARDLPFICANPDQVVERGDRIIYCAGALASAYARLGGSTRIAGKPHAPIYAEALRRVETLRGPFDRARVVAIGDGISTDIRGALDNGLDAVFVARGIHAVEYYADGHVDEARLDAFLARESAVPAYWVDGLI
jgi:HAD-superfamily class IIA hydrolase, TIGR01459